MAKTYSELLGVPNEERQKISLITRLSPHPDKNKMEEESLVWICTILWHDDVTAIISKNHDAIL